MQKNLLIQNRFVLDGQTVDLRNNRCQLLNMYGKSDYLAPPGSSVPLGNAVGSSDVTTLGVDSGHVGIFVGSMSYRSICPKITSWIKSR
jgi:polyhydroxyalkanoate synthase